MKNFEKEVEFNLNAKKYMFKLSPADKNWYLKMSVK